MKNNKAKEEKRKDLIIEIILAIIIILLLIHNCSIINKKEKKPTGSVNIIDISCENKKCDQQQEEKLPIDCLNDTNNNKCLIPNFIGKTKEDIINWLNSISNTIEIEYVTKESNKKDGTVLEQSITGITIKELIDNNKKLIITISNKGSLVNCLKDEKNQKCRIPNFVGKTKEDIINWLNSIENHIKIKYIYQNSTNKFGTISAQSIKSGTELKRILEKGETLVITIYTKNNNYSTSNKKTTNNNKADNNSNNNNNQNKPTEDNNEQEEFTEDSLYVNDPSIKWQDETELKIFKNSLYNFEEKIAPESSNTYQFVVNNGTSYKLKYNISFIESNPYSINMKYKLKKNNTYIIDHYVSYNELNISDIELNSQKKDTYYLEWKWVSSDNDNSAGKNNANYSLKIDIKAESV